jgi:hypothetical protein
MTKEADRDTANSLFSVFFLFFIKKVSSITLEEFNSQLPYDCELFPTVNDV